MLSRFTAVARLATRGLIALAVPRAASSSLVMRQLILACAAATLLAPAAARATTIVAYYSEGTWFNAAPAGGVFIDNTSSRTRSARWGVPLTSFGQSGYDYLPNFPGLVSVDGPAFLLGTFTHVNQAIDPPWLTSIQLAFDLRFINLLPNLTGDFTFSHDETPNTSNPCRYGGALGQGVNINGCADRVIISSPFLNTLISDGTNTYYFTILGFSTDSGATTSDTFLSAEGSNNSAELYGRATSVPVSEPASLLLIGAVLAGLTPRLREWKGMSRRLLK